MSRIYRKLGIRSRAELGRRIDVKQGTERARRDSNSQPSDP
jgi:hypothetical protein